MLSVIQFMKSGLAHDLYTLDLPLLFLETVAWHSAFLCFSYPLFDVWKIAKEIMDEITEMAERTNVQGV